MTPLAYIDTETLGLNPEVHPIWEIAVIIPDGPNQGEHCWQIRLTDTEIEHADPEALKTFEDILERTEAALTEDGVPAGHPESAPAGTTPPDTP